MLESKLVQYSVYDRIIRRARIMAVLWLPYLFWWTNLDFRFLLLVLIESTYNLCAFLFRPSSREVEMITQLTKKPAGPAGVAVVTGCTSGIGREIATALAAAGFHLHLPVRSRTKADSLVAELKSVNPDAKVRVYDCDLSKTADVHRFIAQLSTTTKVLDILINNAGNFSPTFSLSKDGIESHMAVHVIAPYLLLVGLLESLKRSRIARVVNVSSSALYILPSLDVPTTAGSALARKNPFSRFSGYSSAKYALTLVMMQLAEQLRDSGVTINSVHPGMVDTEISRDDKVGHYLLKISLKTFFPFLILSPLQGALTAIWLALSEETKGMTGCFFHDLVEEPISYPIKHDLERGFGRELLAFCKTAVPKK